MSLNTSCVGQGTGPCSGAAATASGTWTSSPGLPGRAQASPAAHRPPALVHIPPMQPELHGCVPVPQHHPLPPSQPLQKQTPSSQCLPVTRSKPSNTFQTSQPSASFPKSPNEGIRVPHSWLLPTATAALQGMAASGVAPESVHIDKVPAVPNYGGLLWKVVGGTTSIIPGAEARPCMTTAPRVPQGWVRQERSCHPHLALSSFQPLQRTGSCLWGNPVPQAGYPFVLARGASTAAH